MKTSDWIQTRNSKWIYGTGEITITLEKVTNTGYLIHWKHFKKGSHMFEAGDSETAKSEAVKLLRKQSRELVDVLYRIIIN